jgi:D-serine dehydratase
MNEVSTSVTWFVDEAGDPTLFGKGGKVVAATRKGKKSARESAIFNKEHPLTLESRAGVGKKDREI